MLAGSSIVAFLATADSKRARSFYKQVLGLRFISDDDFAIVFDGLGAPLRAQKVQDVAPRQFTVLGWSVASIDAAAAALEARGVRFERYEFLDQEAQGIWRSPSGARVAWLKDLDRNLLSLTEPG
jgi:catechol 2,3-dioxygenase-like lactoylglutathione lyase family enzyme